MGKLRFVALSLAIAACGSDDRSGPADASIDAPKVIDAKVWNDAPPGPMYDLTCFGVTPPTAVDASITVTGQTAELGQGGSTPVGNIEVSIFKVGGNTASATVTSSTTAGSEGEFSSGAITTNGMGLEYLKALDLAATPTYRTTYLYPPYPLRASQDGVPVVLLAQSTLDTLSGFGIGTQDDTNNGMLVVIVNDCSTTDPKALDGADLTVKQGNTNVGDIIDLGQLIPQAAGTFFVLNVPDGATDVTASFDGKVFPTHTVVAHKKPNGQGAMGTVTATAIPPGPLN